MAWEKPAPSAKIDPEGREKYAAFDKALLAVDKGSQQLEAAYNALLKTRDQIPGLIESAIGTNQAGVRQIAATVAKATADETRKQVLELLVEASNAIDNNAHQMKAAAKSMGRRWLRDALLVVVSVIVAVTSMYFLDTTRRKDIVNGRTFAAIWPKLSKKAQAEILKAAEDLNKAPVTTGAVQLPKD